MKFKAVVLILPLLIACNNPQDQDNQKLEEKTDSPTEVSTEIKEQSQADRIVSSSVSFHGGEKYDNAAYAFNFRGRAYSFKNMGDQYAYTLKKVQQGDTIEDQMTGDTFERKTNGTLISELPDTMVDKYRNSLNSVIYFATLPHKLNDPAVLKSYKGTTVIKGIEYEKVEIRFEQEGGGTDHDDVYMYWFRKDNHAMDYLAYLYHVNEGGVRFRSAYNRRKVEGVVFQDYVNYKAEVGTPLEELPVLFEKKQLEELSKIETENVRAIQ
jgi:hypothetical protein